MPVAAMHDARGYQGKRRAKQSIGPLPAGAAQDRAALLMVWAFMVGNSLTEESRPEDSFFTSFFADKK